MNLADAIRRAAQANGEALGCEPKPTFEAVSAPTPMEPAVPATSLAQEIEMKSPEMEEGDHAHHNVVRLELLLNPEQLKGFFGAVIGAQHTVLTAKEGASFLRISTGTLEKLASEGEIPGVLVDGKWRFVRQALEDWLTSQGVRKEA